MTTKPTIGHLVRVANEVSLYHDRFGIRVSLEGSQAVDKGRAGHRVAADAADPSRDGMSRERESRGVLW